MIEGHLARTSPYPLNLVIERAEGSRIYDTDGKSYIDFISGIGVSALGHNHPHIVSSIKKQLDKHLHTMVYGEFRHEVVENLGKALQDITPTEIDTFYLTNSGTEANEAAIKLVKRATGRTQIVSMKGSYHGSTNGSLSISGNEEKKYAFRPLLPDVQFIEFNNEKELERISDKTAAVFIETIQGDAGVRVPNQHYMKQLRQRCNEIGALLVMDEIQCGFGRTGTWWAFEQFDILPDIITMGKALGGGMPIGCLAANRNLLENFTSNPVLGHISTFAGHPLVASASLAAIEVMTNEALIQRASVIEKRIYTALSNLPQVKEIRHQGALFGVELADETKVEQMVKTALDRGLLLYFFLSCRNSFRLAPPLNISDSDLSEAIDIMTNVIKEVG